VYRFTGRHTRDEQYVREGPPHPLPRIIGPLIVLSTITVLGTGFLPALEEQPETYFGYSLVFIHELESPVRLGLGAGAALAARRRPSRLGLAPLGRDGRPRRRIARLAATSAEPPGAGRPAGRSGVARSAGRPGSDGAPSAGRG
jgi:hypothetical protein